MSSNKVYHKAKICNVFGKVMYANNFKRHISLKHRNVKNILHQKECYLESGDVKYEKKHNNKPLVEGCKVKELSNSLVTYPANLK